MSIDRTVAPPIKEIESFNIVKAKKIQFPNSILFYQINAGESDMVKIEWIFPAGLWYQPAPLVAFTVNNMLMEGSEQYKSAQIAEMIEYYGASVTLNIDKDNAFVTLVCMHKYLSEVMAILEDIIKNAIFPDNELTIFKRKHKQQFLIEQSIYKNIARIIHSRMLFGKSHPYGLEIVEKDFDNLNRNELFKFYKEQYQSKHCRIIASGKIDDYVIKVVEKHFGTDPWNNSKHDFSKSFVVETEKERSIYVEKPKALQSAVRLGKVLFNKMHPDYTGLSVVTCILGGYMGSRLMQKIREEKGYTYGINSILVTFKHSGCLLIASELGASVTSAAINDIYGELEKLRKYPVPQEELQRVKNYMLGDLVRMFDGPFAQAESLISLLEFDLDYDYFFKAIDTIKNITADEIQRLSQKHIDPESFSQCVVGKM
jgi:zinc protease